MPSSISEEGKESKREGWDIGKIDAVLAERERCANISHHCSIADETQ